MTRKEIKEAAKKDLSNNIFSSAWLFAVIAVLIYSLVVGISGCTIIIGLIIAGPVTYGLCRGFVRIARGEEKEFGFGHFFDGFKESFGPSFIASLLMDIYTILWSLLLIVPGIIKSYSYAMTMYILQDEPNIGANEAITKSRKMMNGHKWQLFVLDLSFIGWYIVGALCLGVGTIWVDAYRQAARAHFYESIR